MIHSVGKKTLTAAGGAQRIDISNTLCKRYHFSFRSVGATPLAGTTAIAATQTGGTEETLLDSAGAAMNLDPTSLKSFSVGSPIESVKFTPSSWTASVEIVCEILGEVY